MKEDKADSPNSAENTKSFSNLFVNTFSLLGVLFLSAVFVLYFFASTNSKAHFQRFNFVDSLIQNSSKLLSDSELLYSAQSAEEGEIASSAMESSMKSFELGINNVEEAHLRKLEHFLSKYVPVLKADTADDLDFPLLDWGNVLKAKKKYESNSQKQEQLHLVEAANALQDAVVEFARDRKNSYEQKIHFYETAKLFLVGLLFVTSLIGIVVYLFASNRTAKLVNTVMEKFNSDERTEDSESEQNLISQTKGETIPSNRENNTLAEEGAFEALFNTGTAKSCITDGVGNILKSNKRFSSHYGLPTQKKYSFISCVEEKIPSEDEQKLCKFFQLLGMNSVNKEQLLKLNPVPQLFFKSEGKHYDLTFDYFQESGQGRVLVSVHDSNTLEDKVMPPSDSNPFIKVVAPPSQQGYVTEKTLTPSIEEKVYRYAMQVGRSCVIKCDPLNVTNIDKRAEKLVEDSLVHMASLCLTYFSQGDAQRNTSKEPTLSELSFSAKFLDKENSLLPGEEWLQYSYQDDGVGIDQDLVIQSAINSKILDKSEIENLDSNTIIGLLMNKNLRLSPERSDVPQNLAFLKDTIVGKLNGKIKVSYIQDKYMRLDALIPRARMF